MSISCNVSGLKYAVVQDFAFSVYKTKDPNIKMQIISTNDQSYPYAVYSARVRNKNIVIERLSGTSALFHINSLEMEDSGLYECFTPNTYRDYYGSYSAETTMNGNLFFYFLFSIYQVISHNMILFMGFFFFLHV